MTNGWNDLLRASLSDAGGWAVTALRIVAIMAVAWIGTSVLQGLIRRFRVRIAQRMEDPEAVKRAETLGRVFRYRVAVVMSLVAGVLVLSEIGISVAPILGAAGVVGLAVGFGAQSLVKDYFTGFFLLLENQIRQGDVVKLGEHSGLVEEVTLRYVRLRDYDGHVHFVPNGQIGAVVNLSRGYAQAVVDVGVAYREDLDRVMAVMLQVAQVLRDDAAYRDRILDKFELAGVERWDESAVVLRGRIRVAPLAQWDVRREYLRRLKAAFDQHGIEIPFPQLALHAPLGLLRPARSLATSERGRQHGEDLHLAGLDRHRLGRGSGGAELAHALGDFAHRPRRDRGSLALGAVHARTFSSASGALPRGLLASADQQVPRGAFSPVLGGRGLANPRHSGAMAVVCALQPSPNQGAHTREDLFSMALTRIS